MKKHKLDTDRYLTIEEATELADKANYGYRDIRFDGMVRIFGTVDAYLAYTDDYAYDDEDFDAFQVRMTLADKLDIDLNGEGKRRPWYRPFNITTGGKLLTPNIKDWGKIH